MEQWGERKKGENEDMKSKMDEKTKRERRFRYCLMIFKRSKMDTPDIKYEYIHFKESDEDDAIAYAEKYSKEHDGYVIRLRLRIWCKELNRVEWRTIISFYNGRIFSNSLLFRN